MTLFIVGVIVSFSIFLIVGLLVGRTVKSADDYYVTGRNATTLFLAGTLFVSMLSVNGFTGDQGWVYSGNLTSLVLLNAICAIGYIVGPLVFGRYLRRTRCRTMPEYFGMRFSDLRNRRVAGVITIVSITAYLLATYTGVSILLQELTGLPFWACVMMVWAASTGFTFYAGSKGVIVTDLIMFLVFMGGSVFVCYFIIQAQGGLSELMPNLIANPYKPEGLLNYHGNIPGTGADSAFGSIMYSVTLGIVWMVVFAVSPWQAGRNLMAKNEHVILRAGAICAILTVMYLLFLNMASISVLNINPHLEDPQRVLIWASINVVPPLLGVLLLSGIMAAGLSSDSTFLSVIGFSATTDLVKREFKSDKHLLSSSRKIMLGVGVIALILTLMGLAGVRIIAWFASEVIASSWLVAGVGSVVSKKLSSTGARWAMMSGFISFMITRSLVGLGIQPFAALFVNFLHPFFIGVAISLLFAILGSRLHPITAAEKEFYDKMMVIPASEVVAKEYATDRKFGYLLVAAGVVTTTLLLFGWALPFNGYI
ncbi:MAG: sodium:solute symporter family protein [Oscillospiraceae bacterium]|nr:sodium:solute symporter family protein [Oscillospiraceae bacterium]